MASQPQVQGLSINEHKMLNSRTNNDAQLPTTISSISYIDSSPRVQGNTVSKTPPPQFAWSVPHPPKQTQQTLNKSPSSSSHSAGDDAQKRRSSCRTRCWPESTRCRARFSCVSALQRLPTSSRLRSCCLLMRVRAPRNLPAASFLCCSELVCIVPIASQGC